MSFLKRNDPLREDERFRIMWRSGCVYPGRWYVLDRQTDEEHVLACEYDRDRATELKNFLIRKHGNSMESNV